MNQTINYTDQIIFTKVVEHLRKQNKKSINEDSVCLYRGPNGLKCAIGCLIPDELYDLNFNDRGITILISKDTAIANLFKNVNQSLLEKLQAIHDMRRIEDWEMSWKKIAKEYDLKMP